MLICSFANEPVFAGAWTQEKGSAYFRASSAFEDHASVKAQRNDIYAEYGMTSNWTVSAKYERVDFSDHNVFDSDGWRITARRRLWSSSGFITSAEIGVLEGAALGGFRGCESRGLEAGFGAGYSGHLAGTDFYTGLTIARREHEDDCYHDRLEAVLGYTQDKKWFWTGQLWSERGENDQSDKVELMLSRRFRQFEIGVGYRKEVSGEFTESASVLALSFQPNNKP